MKWVAELARIAVAAQLAIPKDKVARQASRRATRTAEGHGNDRPAA